jgi:hypothetical protein
MTLEEFINKTKPHDKNNSAPPYDPVNRHLWECKQLYSVFDCLHSDCSVLDYGCGGNGTLQYTLFNYFPNAKYYGLDVNNHNFSDNTGFEIKDNNNSYFRDISDLSNILPKVDCMILGSVFTHLGLNEIIKILDKTLPYYDKGFQLCFTAFLGNDIIHYNKDKEFDYWWIVVLTIDWIKVYCDKHNLNFKVQPYVFNLDHKIPLGLTHQNFITIKKND